MPSIHGFRSALSSVFKFVLPEIQDSFVLWDLICSFELESPLSPVDPLIWNLVWVLFSARQFF